MQTIFITGNVGKDPTLRTTQNGDQVLNFSVGVKQGYGDRASTNWFRVNVWGKRADSLSGIIRKGSKVAVSGEFSTSEYEGKTQLEVRAADIDVMTPRDDATPRQQRQTSAPAGNDFADDLDDDCPF